MWFFDQASTYAGYVRSWFYDTGREISGIPFVGSGLAGPFNTVSGYFGSLSSAFSQASGWADGVFNAAWQILTAIDPGLRAAFPVLTAGGSWFFDRVRAYCESYWSILTATAYTIFTRIQGYIPSTWPILGWSSGQFFSWIRGEFTAAFNMLTWGPDQWFAWVRGRIDAAYSILADTRSSLWSWISGYQLPGWIQTWWNAQETAVLAFVTGKWGYLIDSGFSFIEGHWSSFKDWFSWLLLQLLQLALDRMASFAPLIWSTLEEFLKNIQVNK